MKCIHWHCLDSNVKVRSRDQRSLTASPVRVCTTLNKDWYNSWCCQIRSSNLAIIDRVRTHQIKPIPLSKPPDKLRLRPEDSHAIISRSLKAAPPYQSSSVALSSFNNLKNERTERCSAAKATDYAANAVASPLARPSHFAAAEIKVPNPPKKRRPKERPI